MNNALPDRVRFGPFEIRISSGELREGERRIVLQNQTWTLLLLLVASEGAIVTREEIKKELWPNDTMVEFDHSINAAIKKLRKALGDSAEEPRYIETAARRGYRLMIAVERAKTDPKGESSSAGVRYENAVAPEDPPSAGLTGKTFSHYRVLDIIGGGGMGVVYRAEDLKLGRAVALKFLPEELGSDIRALELFEREARAASALDHPNICSIYEFGEHEGQPFIVMQLLEGQTLRDRLFGSSRSDGKAGQPFDLGQLLDVAMQITEGLQAAHEKGIIHRDIKPANIFLTRQGTVAKILDFGIAKLQAGEKPDAASGPVANPAIESADGEGTALTFTHLGMAMGTAGYMSPEQMRGEKLDARTDLYSFGLVLYEMATGMRAFGGPTTEHSLDSIPKDMYLAAHAPHSGIPARLEQIIAKALRKDREARYQNALAIRADLQDLRRESDGSAGPRRRRWSGRQIVAVAGMAAIAALFILSLVRPMEPLPEVVSIVALTDSGTITPNQTLVTDGPRLFFREFIDGKRMLNFVRTNQPGERTVVGPFETTDVQAISPDGADLLVDSIAAIDEQGGGKLSIYSLAGESHRNLQLRAHDGTWTADGHFILGVGSSLVETGTDGEHPRTLLSVTGLPYCPRVSPDGRTLRFVVGGEEVDRPLIWEAKSDGSHLRRLFPQLETFPQWCGDWSPDGREFFFDATEEGRRTVWVQQEKSDWLHRRHTEPVKLIPGPIEFFRVISSRDGRYLFAIGEKKHGELMRLDQKRGEYVSFMGGISAEQVDFSHDGKWVAYVLFPQGTLWRSRVDGTDRVQLTFPPMMADAPRWSPDGAQIVFAGIAQPGERRNLYVTGGEGGLLKPLLKQSEGEDETVNWDGPERVIFSRRTPERNEIFSYDLRSQKLDQIPGSPPHVWPRVSPDGKWIEASDEKTGEIFLYDRSLREWRDLGITGWAPDWSADSSYLYFDSSFNLTPRMKRIRIADRRVQEIASPALVGTGIHGSWTGLTPDGDVLMLKDLSTTDLYAIELKRP